MKVLCSFCHDALLSNHMHRCSHAQSMAGLFVAPQQFARPALPMQRVRSSFLAKDKQQIDQQGQAGHSRWALMLSLTVRRLMCRESGVQSAVE